MSRTGSPRVISPTAAAAATSSCAPGPSPSTTSTHTAAETCNRHMPQQRRQEAASVLPRRTDTAPHTCFYFTVFFSNNPPIFHSNRIAPERLGSQAATATATATATAAPAASPSSPCTGCQQEYWRSVFGEPGADRAGRPGVAFGTASSDDISAAATAAAAVGDYRTSMGTMEEVPLQTLQNVAFPTTFGSCGGTCAVPVRTLRRHAPSASANPAPTAPLPPAVYIPSGAAASAPTPTDTPPRHATTTARTSADTRTAVSDATTPAPSRFSLDAEKAQATAAAPGTASIPAGGGHTAQSTRVSSTSTFNTLPLTNSSGATTPLNGAAELPCGAAAEPVVPDRFKPTFPAVQWKEPEAEAGDAVAPVPPALASATPAAHPARVRAVGQVRTRRPRIATTPTSTAPAAAEAGNGCRPTTAVPSAALRHPLSAAAAAVHADPAEQPKAALTPVPDVSPITPAPAAVHGAAADAAAAAHHVTPPKTVTSAALPAAAAPVAAAAPPTAPGQEGPPWNMRVEEVRSAKGELRYYRIVLTAAFAALVTTHTGLMHSMQTRNAATALVLLCPPCGRHYRFLLQHADILRSVLNRATEFGIRTVQRFFGLLYSPTQKPKGSQQQVLKAIATLLETHPEALDTYRGVKAELASALALRFPLPLLLPTASAWTVPVLTQSSLSTTRARSIAGGGGGGGAGGGVKARTRRRDSSNTTTALATRRGTLGSPTVCASAGASFAAASPTAAAATTAAASVPVLADILYEAASFVREFSEAFASAYICGLLSLTARGPGTRGLRTRRQPGAGAVTAAAAAATAANVMSVSSPSVSAVDVMPSHAPRGPSPTTTREASPLFAGVPPTESVGGPRDAPAWLSPYAAFFHALGDAGDPLHGIGGEDGAIDYGKPAAVELDGYGSRHYRGGGGLNSDESDESDDADGALTAHVSVSTMSSQTPVVSPLTIDVSSSNAAAAGGSATRSPTLQFLRSRNSHATLSSNLASPHLSSTTNPLAAQSLGPMLPTPLTEALGASTATPAAAAAAVARAAPSRHSSANMFPPSPSSTAAAATTSTVAVGSAGEGARGGGQPAATTSADALASAASTGPAAPPPPPSNSAAKPAGGDAAREDEYVLHRERLGRVVIFTQDAVLARRLLVLAAFLWSDGATAAAATAAGWAGGRGAAAAASSRVSGREESEAALRTAEAQHMYETAVAAAVSSAEYSSVPVQWVAEEFCETRMGALCSRYSPENTLLVVVPRQLQCRRVYLRKHVAGTTVLVEEVSGKGARIRSAPFPFRCAVARQVVVQPDPTVTTLLCEACTLHQSSRGAVSFADVFQRMVRWLYWQTAATVMARETHAQAATRAASQASVHGGGATLSRFTSADAVWPSSGLSAEGASLSGDGVGSRLTTPLAVSPAVRLSRSSASAKVYNASASSPVCRRDGALWGSAGSGWAGGPWGEAESVEEALLPGSMGYASGAWAYTANAASSNGGGAASTIAAAGAAASAGPSLTSNPRGGASVPVTPSLLTSHGLVQPPSVFTFASPTTASPSKSASSFKFFNWFRSSPTSATGAATSASTAAAGRSHPILSPTTLGQMYSADGGVGGQLPRLLAGDDDDDDGLFE